MWPFALQYDEYKSPMDNIGMQDSLLSRFDMIFVVLDEMDPDHDRRISEHVLRMHRYRNPGEQVCTCGSDGIICQDKAHRSSEYSSTP